MDLKSSYANPLSEKTEQKLNEIKFLSGDLKLKENLIETLRSEPPEAKSNSLFDFPLYIVAFILSL